MAVGARTALRLGEAALHRRALAGAALFAEQPAEQSRELLPHAPVHVTVDVRVEAALHEEEHERQGEEPGRDGRSGSHGHSVQDAVRPHAEDIGRHDDENHTRRLAVVVEPSVANPDRVARRRVRAVGGGGVLGLRAARSLEVLRWRGLGVGLCLDGVHQSVLSPGCSENHPVAPQHDGYGQPKGQRGHHDGVGQAGGPHHRARLVAAVKVDGAPAVEGRGALQ